MCDLEARVPQYVPSNRDKRFPVEIPTRDEVNAILRLCSRRAPSGVRNRALIVIMYRAGLRLQEALDLLPKDIDYEHGRINVRVGKGGKQRIVGVDDEALTVIEGWMQRRKSLGLNGRRPLFCLITAGRIGEPMGQQAVRDMLKRLAERAGIEKRVHPHGLRHACFSEMVAEGFDLARVSQAAGHQSLVVTQRYIAKIAPHRLAEAMRSRQWSAA
jgi:site-specific recombinase XerD